MKKALLLVAALAIGGAAFAQNKTVGLDIHIGLPLHLTTITGKPKLPTAFGDIAMPSTEFDDNDLGFQIKFASYSGLWLNGHIGLYGSIGINFGLINGYITAVEGGARVSPGMLEMLGKQEFDFGMSGEFMFGPAFGVSFGKEGSMRFQSGVALHAVVGSKWANYKYLELIDVTERYTTAALGLALTPQLRVLANKKLSFVVGADLAFDFHVLSQISYDFSSPITEGDSATSPMADIEIESSFRFGFTPYIGVGFNF